MEDVPDLDCVLTPCSGGGLFAGVATAAKALNPSIRCYPSRADTADDTRQSFMKGERVFDSAAADDCGRVARPDPGQADVSDRQQLAEDVLTVTDEEIIETLRFILFRMKLLVETVRLPPRPRL